MCKHCSLTVEEVGPLYPTSRTATIQLGGVVLVRNFLSKRVLPDEAILQILTDEGFDPIADNIVIIDTPRAEELL